MAAMSERRPAEGVSLELLLEHRAWVRGLARALVVDPNDADDLEQETWRMALERPPRHGGAIRAWFGRVLRNAAAAAGRSRGRRRKLEGSEFPAGKAPSTGDVVAEAELQAWLVQSVLELGEPYRTTVLQRYFHGIEASAIAAQTGTPVETVRTRLKRGVALLRERMGGELGHDREAWGLLLHGVRGRPVESPPERVPKETAGAAGGALAMAIGMKAAAGGAAIIVTGLAWWLWPERDLETASVGSRSGLSRPVPVAPVPDRPRAPDATASEATEPPTTGSRFLGRVVDPEGRPVGGAMVTATPMRSAPELGTGTAGEVRGLTAGDGAFEVRLHGEAARADVTVAADGYAVVCVERARPEVPLEVRLRREGVLSGQVLDPTGRPVAGAAVRVFRVLGHEHIDRVAMTTGADGEYHIGGFDTCTSEAGAHAPMRRPFLDVRAGGFGAMQVWGPFPGPGETLRRNVVLYPARPLPVLVSDADSGRPLMGATVTAGLAATGLQVIVPGELGHVLPHPAPFIARGTTGADGTCRLEEVPGDLPALEQIVVRAWREGFTAEFAAVRGRRDTGDERVEIRLWPSATVTGRVVDPSGCPVPSAGVYCQETNASWFPVPTGDMPWQGMVETDGAGRYSLPCVPASVGGTKSARILTWGARGPTADGKLFTIPSRVMVDVHPRAGGTTVAPDLVLPEPRPARVARFVVVDRGGAPVPDALLTSLTDAARDAPARVDERGEATLHWASEVDTGHPVVAEPTLRVTAPGFARTVVRCRPETDSVPEVRVVLDAGARIEGKVIEEDGRPIVGVPVSALCDGVDPFWAEPTTSGQGGEFVFEDLPTRPFRVLVSTASRFDPSARVAQADGVLPDGPPIELRLPPPSVPTGTLVVEAVAREDGSRLPGATARVDIEPQSKGAISDSSDPGLLTIASVPAGRWRVTVAARGRVSVSAVAAVEAGKTTRLRLALPRGTPVEVRAQGVPDMKGRWGRGAHVQRVDAVAGEPDEGGAAWVFTGTVEDGIYRFHALPSGHYLFAIEFEGVPEQPATSGESGDGPFGGWSTGARSPPEVYVAETPFEVRSPGGSTQRVIVQVVRGGCLSVGVHDPAVPLPVPRPRSMSGGGAGGENTKQPEDPEAEERIRLAALDRPAWLEVLAPDGSRQYVAMGVCRGGLPRIPLRPGDFVVRLHLPTGEVREATVSISAGARTNLAFDAR